MPESLFALPLLMYVIRQFDDNLKLNEKLVLNRTVCIPGCATDYFTIAQSLQSLATVENSIASSHKTGLDRCVVVLFQTNTWAAIRRLRKLCNLRFLVKFCSISCLPQSRLSSKLQVLFSFCYRGECSVM